MDSAPKPSPMLVAELRAMIGRAEMACERYQRAAAVPGLSALKWRRRIRNLKQMETAIAWLQSRLDASLENETVEEHPP